MALYSLTVDLLMKSASFEKTSENAARVVKRDMDTIQSSMSNAARRGADARLSRFPYRTATLRLGPAEGYMGAVVEWPADRPGFAGEGARGARAPRCPEDVADQGCMGGERRPGQAVRRAVVRGQALPRDAAASRCGSDGGRLPEGTSTDVARPAADTRTAAAGPASGRGGGEGAGAGQGSAGAAPVSVVKRGGRRMRQALGWSSGGRTVGHRNRMAHWSLKPLPRPIARCDATVIN